ncbi:hypothetical protein [Haliea salexigens]|uniref:hypothetical protein n=1 Tax=Haliea salexigens TaxID=287487 RepID=UPI000424068D|nr:hypothetical protein [Haliea salexigens]
MAYVATLQKPWISGSASLVPTWVDDAVATTTLITGFDGGNASSSLSSITGATTLTPTLEIDSRDGDWRHLLFAVEGVEGKTPVFKLNRATLNTPAFAPTTDFLPLWTQDFVTWTQATSRTLTGGTSGTIDFSFDGPLPSGRVYVSTHPMGQNADAATFAAELLADYSSVAAPTTSADSSGVYNTTPTETGDDGRAVGGNGQYAIKLAWGGSTTDSGPKRKLVMFAGIHAAGEHVSWVSFVASVRHMLDATEAADFRSNWDVYLYFNVTANGIVGGESRQNPSRNIDPNRDFVDQDLQEIDALTTAILADTSGSADAQFAWNSFGYEQDDDFIPGTGESPNTETAAFITKGNTIFSSLRTYYLDIPTAGYRWGYDVLGAKIAFAAEVPMRGDTSVAFYEGIGENWIKTLQAIDADGVFYSSTTITASWAVQGQAGVSMSAEVVSAAAMSAAASHSSVVSGMASTEASIPAGVEHGATATAGANALADMPVSVQARASMVARADFVASITATASHDAAVSAGATSAGSMSVSAEHSQAMAGQVDSASQIQAAMVVSATVSATASAEAQALASMLASVEGGTTMATGSAIDATISLDASAGVGMSATVEAVSGFSVNASAGATNSAGAQAQAILQVSVEAASALIAQAAAQAGIPVSHIHNITITATSIAGDLVTPASRTFRVELELRGFIVEPDNRTFTVH